MEANAYRERLRRLRGLRDAAYGCGDWLAGASFARAVQLAEREEIDEPSASERLQNDSPDEEDDHGQD